MLALTEINQYTDVYTLNIQFSTQSGVTNPQYNEKTSSYTIILNPEEIELNFGADK